VWGEEVGFLPGRRGVTMGAALLAPNPPEKKGESRVGENLGFREQAGRPGVVREAKGGGDERQQLSGSPTFI